MHELQAVNSHAVNYHADVITPGADFHIRKDKTNPRRVAYLVLLLTAGTLQSGGVRPELLFAGAIFAVLGVLLHGWAAGFLARAGYRERTKKVLTVRGPYRHCRNPYYLAHLLMDFGFFCLAGVPLYFLLYFPVIFYVYHYRWILKEEKFLEKEFGEDYLCFVKEVPRWRFQVKPGPARGPEQKFSWATFFLNREHTRALPHLALVAIFSCFADFGNPFEAIDPLFRTTFLFGYATWLVCHDIFPVKTSYLSFRWLLVSIAGALGGVIYLLSGPFAENNEPRLLPIAGAGLGIFVALTSLPSILHLLGMSPQKLYPRAMSQWFLAFLALGLVTEEIEAVWFAVTVSFVCCALAVAGVLKVKRFPARVSFAVFLCIGYTAAAIVNCLPLSLY